MNKRGQFYIIIALIISLALFGITYKVNEITEPVLFTDFNDVSENYVSEATKVVNDALEMEEEDVDGRIEEFTDSFLDYAKQRNPNLGLLYIYSNGGDITIENHLDESIVIDGENILGGDEIIQGITLEVGGNEFVHQVPISADDFGEDWTSMIVPIGPISLSIGGIINSFELTGLNNFKIIVRTESGEYKYDNVQQDWI
jgi:hypothetical protein